MSADGNFVNSWVVDSKFKKLTFCGRFDQGTLDAERSTGDSFGSLFVTWGTLVDNNLKRVEITSVVELNEANVGLRSGGFGPSSNFNDLTDYIFVSLEKSGNSNSSAKRLSSNSFTWNNIVP